MQGDRVDKLWLLPYLLERLLLRQVPYPRKRAGDINLHLPPC